MSGQYKTNNVVTIVGTEIIGRFQQRVTLDGRQATN